MRIVSRPSIFPSQCAVLPYVGASRTDQWVDTGAEIIAGPKDRHVYVSDIAVFEMARLFGWVGPGAMQVAERRVTELEREMDVLKAQLAEAERYAEAIDLLESKGYTARKKVGRPRREVEA